MPKITHSPNDPPDEKPPGAGEPKSATIGNYGFTP
jgi:hypothetical protein